MNTMEVCKQLDDFLDGDLTPEEAKCFREHAEVCGECRANLDAMAEFDGMVAEAKSSFDDWYVNHIRRDRSIRIDEIGVLKHRSLTNRVMASVALVAATIALVVAARNIAIRMPDSTPPREIGSSTRGVELPSHESAVGTQLTKASLSMGENSRYLAEPIESSNPNITIYWLHQTVDADAVDGDSDSSSFSNTQSNLLAGRTL